MASPESALGLIPLGLITVVILTANNDVAYLLRSAGITALNG